MCTTSAVWLSVVLSSRYFTEIHRRTSHPSHQLECFRWRVSSLLEPLHAVVSWCLPFPYPQLSWISIMLFGWRNPTTCSGLKISVSKVTRFFHKIAEIALFLHMTLSTLSSVDPQKLHSPHHIDFSWENITFFLSAHIIQEGCDGSGGGWVKVQLYMCP
jgi:hypothetical protein